MAAKAHTSVSMPITLRDELRALAERERRTVAMQVRVMFDEWRKLKGAGN